MSDKLKPCPLCGGDAKLESHPGWIKSVHYQELWTVSCTKCTLENTMHLTCPEDAIYRWNRRPLEDALSKRIAELERTVDDLRGELAQSDKVADKMRIAELEAERDKYKNALRKIILIPIPEGHIIQQPCEICQKRINIALKALKDDKS